MTKYAHAEGHTLPSSVRVIEAGHPVPDSAGLAGAQAVADLLSTTTPQDRVILLVSGGASALLPLPVDNVSLADLQATTDLLLRAGATINEINAVRKHLSQLKGGQLARLSGARAGRRPYPLRRHRRPAGRHRLRPHGARPNDVCRCTSRIVTFWASGQMSPLQYAHTSNAVYKGKSRKRPNPAMPFSTTSPTS